MTFKSVPDLAPACLALAALLAAGAAVASGDQPPVSLDIQAHQTLVTFPASLTDSDAQPRSSLIALPADAERADAVLVAGAAERVALAGGVMRMRGQALACVVVEGGGGGPVTVAVRHDGSWNTAAPARLASAQLWADVPGRPAAQKAAVEPGSGSYVIITAPALETAVAPLAEWKLRKGWPVVVVTTNVTGGTTASIKNWLQNAYDTWDRAPEYVLLVGDTAEIPPFTIISNYTDQPYIELEGDDWLPDAMIGRLPVSTTNEAQTVVNKTVGYERSPYAGQDGTDDDWFTRSIIVAGNESSSTPTHTVRWCQSQLVRLGFAPTIPLQTEFLQPPLPPNGTIGTLLNNSLAIGSSLVVYRGWALADDGWSTPRYVSTDVLNLNNGWKLPVVLSFVCESGNFGTAGDCFGEVFLNLGSPASPKGAVAFIGNTEDHSHTRQNDAIAISFFEEITRPEITTLGSLMTAGKLRFLEYFPTELDVETYGEVSVQFYFHIYNLLGDPDLAFHKSRPSALGFTTTPAALAAGSHYLEVAVTDVAGGNAPLAGARVGVLQGGTQIGSGWTGADGRARLNLAAVATGAPVEVTVTHAGFEPAEGSLTTATVPGAYLAVANRTVDDDSSAPSNGNGDSLPNPGETLAVLPEIRNSGAVASTAATLAAVTSGPGTVTPSTVELAGVPAGQTASPGVPFLVTIAPEAADGDVVRVLLTATHDGQSDTSPLDLVVRAPRIEVAEVTGAPLPGATTPLRLQLRNAGSAATAGGTVTVALTAGAGVTVVDATAAFGPLAPGQTAAALDPISLQVAAATAVGTGVNLQVTASTSEGATDATGTAAFLVGEMDVTAPVGPDASGYYAYDSADILYPGQKPSYTWTELDPAVDAAATGARITFTADNYDQIVMNLPFTVTYYGQDFASIRISDNGWISFDAANTSYNFYNWPLPSQDGPGAIVAPFWDNLNPLMQPAGNDSTGLGSSGVFTRHDPAAGTFTVEWSRMRHYINSVSGLQTFQVVLLDQDPAATLRADDDILFLYKQVANNDSDRMFASAGCESPDETTGLQLTYDNLYTPGAVALGPGLAVRITTEAPVRVPYTVASLTAETGDGEVRLTWETADERPVTGWEVWRQEAGERLLLTETPLPAATRRFSASAAGGDEVYVLVARHPYGARSEVGAIAMAPATLARLALGPARPNPVPGEASIAFALPRAGDVRLRIFDVRGRCVRTLVDGSATAGENLVAWDGRDAAGRVLPDGVYVYRLESAGTVLTRKLLLVR